MFLWWLMATVLTHQHQARTSASLVWHSSDACMAFSANKIPSQNWHSKNARHSFLCSEKYAVWSSPLILRESLGRTPKMPLYASSACFRKIMVDDVCLRFVARHSIEQNWLHVGNLRRRKRMIYIYIYSVVTLKILAIAAGVCTIEFLCRYETKKKNCSSVDLCRLIVICVLHSNEAE